MQKLCAIKGAKYVFLKTGAYRPEVVAFTMKAASEAKIDMLTFDGAGGGTGKAPVPMMNEMSTPTVHLEAQVLACAQILKKKGKFLPDMVMAGGFVNEGQIYKAMAMSNIGGGFYIKAIAMARAPILAAMKSTYFAKMAESGSLPKSFSDSYSSDPANFFIMAKEMAKDKNLKLGQNLPWGAVGLHTYLVDRLGVGLKQLMAGSRKFSLKDLDRSDIAALNPYASQVTGIETFDQMSSRVMPGILEYWDE
jgi:hypothetical protein